MKLRRLDRTGVYAMAATKLAREDADASVLDGGDDSIGVVLGTSTAGGQSTQLFLEALFRSGPMGAPALLFDSTVGNSAASLVALDFKLRGPNLTLSHKEASGLSAIVTAVDLLREGRASALIAGGVEAIYETVFKAHDRFKVMSPERKFSRRLSPFDGERNGWVMGEGGFALWLEPDDGSNRVRRGEILGVAASSAAVPLNTWPDQPEPLCARCVRRWRMPVLFPRSRTSFTPRRMPRACSMKRRRTRSLVSSAMGSGRDLDQGRHRGVGSVWDAACAAALLCGAVGEAPPIAGLSEPSASAGACGWPVSARRRRTRWR